MGYRAAKRGRFNHFFAHWVVEQKIDGLIYADSSDAPKSFYIVHPYGMSLLLGNWGNGNFNIQLIDYLLNTSRLRDRIEWMQVYPEDWDTQLPKLLGNQLLTKKQKDAGDFLKTELVKIEEHTRVNFKFNIDKYAEFEANHLVERFEIFLIPGQS